MSKFEGEKYYMPANDEDTELPASILTPGNLGSGNIGNIGPNSENEAKYAADLGNEEYKIAAGNTSHCMDDRLEVYDTQLAGNRAVTEVAADYMDPAAEELPLSEAMAKKVKELIDAGFPPNFHEGCAALLLLSNRKSFEFMVDQDNRDQIKELAEARLKVLAINLAAEDYDTALETLADRLSKEDLWDASPEKLFKIAKQNGALIDPISGEHSSVGTRWDMTDGAFNNTMFRITHQGDDGRPMGALSVTLGAYMKQLEKTGYALPQIEQMMLRATLFQLAVLKVAQTENAPDVIVS